MCICGMFFFFSLFRSILNGVTRILDINTDTGSTEINKSNTTEDTKTVVQTSEKMVKVCIYSF